MTRLLRCSILFILPFFCMAQQIERVNISGTITAPPGEDVEGINVYNTSSQKGTITTEDGSFSIAVAENDRVQVTALQFQSFTVIIDKGVVDSRTMGIYLNPAVNQLEEVIVRPYDLSGNIIADVRRIKTSVISAPWDLSYETLEFDYEFDPDALSQVSGNAAEEALGYSDVRAGANVLGLVGLLFPKKKKSQQEVVEDKEVMTNAIRRRFSNNYINETFGIPNERVNDFIYYVEEKGIDPTLMKSSNEILLLEYMREQSVLYSAQFEKE